MAIYAILDKTTNIVTNVVIADDENSIFITPEQSIALASRSVQIGTDYKDFPTILQSDKIFEIRDEVNALIQEHQTAIPQHLNLAAEQLQPHLDYIASLQALLTLETYDEVKSQLDAIGTAPEFPPAPKQITQDVFRGALNLIEKVLWDNPETGTTEQKAVINTLKMEFPYYGVESMTDEFALLKQISFTTSKRITEIQAALA